MSIGKLYILVENIKTGKIFRFPKFAEDKVPDGYRKIYTYKRFNVYEQSELKPTFWAIERLRSENSNKIIVGNIIFEC